MTHAPFGNFHAWCARQRVFKVLPEILVLEKCQRSGPKIGKTFRDERKPHVESLREMLHERTEELCAGRGCRSLNNGAQQFLGASGCADGKPTQRCCRLRFIFGRAVFHRTGKSISLTLVPRLTKPDCFNKTRRIVLFGGYFRLKHCRARLGNFFVLLRAFRSTATDRANDLAVVNNRHAALQRGEVGQRGHREATIVDRVFEILRGLFEDRGRTSFSNGDVRTSSKAFFRPDEVEQITAVVHDRDGRPSTVVLRKFRGSFANLLCALKRKFVLCGYVSLVNVFIRKRKSRGRKKSEKCE